MDRSLDEIVSERRGNGRRGNGGRRNGRNNYPRDGVRKQSTPNERINLESEWVHDMYDDQPGARRPIPRGRERTPEPVYDTVSTKLRVENLHYDLTEEDLDDLFNRIGQVIKLVLTYDRAGRSEGVAYITYQYPEDAQKAIREFDGANAKGQPIRLISIPTGPSGGRRNFEATKSSRPLAERITVAPGYRSRSASPIRHSDTSKPPPSNVDRYVPGQNRRSRSPIPRRREGRRPGARRERGERGGGGGRGERGDKIGRDGRPKKTQEELDAEMEDYWGAKDNGTKENGVETEAAATHVEVEGDIDMIE